MSENTLNNTKEWMRPDEVSETSSETVVDENSLEIDLDICWIFARYLRYFKIIFITPINCSS